MKSLYLYLLVFLLWFIPHQITYSQDDVTVIVPTTEAGESLDLQAVMELYQQAETVEDFEKALNDSSNEVNNLDLNEDGEVDFIRIIEYAEDDAHVLVLQVPLAENEYQDVATIHIEKNGDDVVLQAAGDPDIYGEDYYVDPEPEVEVKTTTVIVVMFGVGYHPWVSPWFWRAWPPWWRPWRPHPASVYRSRVAMHHRAHYRYSRNRMTRRSHNIYKTQRKTSTYAKQKKKKNTYHTQPTKQTKKKEQSKKKHDSRNKSGRKRR